MDRNISKETREVSRLVSRARSALQNGERGKARKLLQQIRRASELSLYRSAGRISETLQAECADRKRHKKAVEDAAAVAAALKNDDYKSESVIT